MANQDSSDSKRMDEKKTERGGATKQGEKDSKQGAGKSGSTGAKSGSKSGQQGGSGTGRGR
jgi:hypothetical protein